MPVLRLVAFAMPALACTIIFTAALNGAGDTRWPLLFTLIGFMGMYALLSILFLFLAGREIGHGPEREEAK